MTAQLPFNGIMNLDAIETSFPVPSHSYARNIRFKGVGNLRPENIKGTRAINKALPAGNNQCIGAFYDELKQRVLYFNYNSAGRNGIYQYDTKTGTITTVLESFLHSVDDIFGFDPSYPIASIVMLYTTDQDGDIIHWVARNNRPCKLNLLDAVNNIYNSNWLAEHLTVARRMPLIAPVCSYADDATVTLNNLRKKLYEFRYRWIYKDFTKSAWSPYSKLFAPTNADVLATDIDQQKNNRIDVVINTGNSDVVKIEIGARVVGEISGSAVQGTFTDVYVMETVDKVAAGLGDLIAYTYGFYNNGVPTLAELREIVLLYDYIPRTANTVELLNGNILIYGGIKEGYTYAERLDVDVSVSLVDNAVIQNPLAYNRVDAQTYEPSNPEGPYGGFYYIYLTGQPQPNDHIHILVPYVTVSHGTQSATVDYTVQVGDGLNTVINNLVSLFQSLPIQTTHNFLVQTIPGTPGGIRFENPSRNGKVLTSVVTISYDTPPVTGSSDVNIAVFKHLSRYGFGIVYFDEYGETNGVVTTANMKIETPEMDTTGATQMMVPAIHFEVNSQPPIWAKYFSWVRTENQTTTQHIALKSAETFKDTSNGFGYLNITNFQTNTVNITAYDFVKGDRCRLIGEYNHPVAVADYPVLGLVTDPAGAPAGTYIKLPYDAATMALFGTVSHEFFYFELYTPASVLEQSLQTYYEFGENYTVIDAGLSTRAHSGKVQDQIAGTQPAKYDFTRGDVYIRQRGLVWIIDKSVSDNYPSKISGTGRAFVIDPYAKEVYHPTLRRYSLAYQQGTNINQTNRFYPANFDELDRQRGDIQRFVVLANKLVTIQSRACGQSGIYEEILSNADGSSNLIRTDQIINKNHYYQGEFGCGDQYCGVGISAGPIYFTDPVKGMQIRLSGDGLTPISEYGAKYYLQPLITKYLNAYVRNRGGLAKILGAYDFGENEFVTVFQGAESQPPETDFAHTDATGIDGYYTYFSGTPVVGYVAGLYIAATGGLTGNYVYTIQPGDSATTVRDALLALAVADGVFDAVTATSGSDPGLRLQGPDGGTTGTTYIAFVPVTLLPADAITFHEARNGYSTTLDYYIEWMICAENTLISWRDGQLYVHDSQTRGYFHGVSYPCVIEKILQDTAKKEFLTVGYHSESAWSAPEITTSERQASNLAVGDYALGEGVYVAAFGRDTQSLGGWTDGDYLMGQWMKMRLKNDATTYQFVHNLYVNYKLSQREF